MGADLLMRMLLIGCVLAAGLAGGIELLPAGPGPYFVTAGDIDGDGQADLVLPNRGELLGAMEKRPANDTITAYLTAGGQKPAVRRDYQVGFGPYTAAIADLDSDGRAEVVVVNFQSNDGRDLSILWGQDGKEPLGAARHYRVEGAPFKYDASRTPSGAAVYSAPGLTSLAIFDANGDKRPDILAVAWSSDFFVLFENLGGRGFRQRRWSLMPGPRDVAVADYNGDGLTDVAFSIYSSNLIEVWTGDGHGAFARSQMFHSQGTIPYHLKAGDVDMDGRVDLVVGNRGPSDNVALFFNRPEGFQYAGSFTAGTARRGEATEDEIRDVLLYDADGDRYPDLAMACHVSHKVVRWKGTGQKGFGQAFGSRRELDLPGKGPRSLTRVPGGLAVALYDSNELGLLPD